MSGHKPAIEGGQVALSPSELSLWGSENVGRFDRGAVSVHSLEGSRVTRFIIDFRNGWVGWVGTMNWGKGGLSSRVTCQQEVESRTACTY